MASDPASRSTRELVLGVSQGTNTVIVTTLVGAGIGMMSTTPPEFQIARWCFILGALLLGVAGIAWLVLTNYPLGWRIATGLLVGALVFVIFPALIRWVNIRQEAYAQTFAAEPASPTLSLSNAGPGQPNSTAVGRKVGLERSEIHQLGELILASFPHNSLVLLIQPDVPEPYVGLLNQLDNLFRQLDISMNMVSSPLPTPQSTGLILYVDDPNHPISYVEQFREKLAGFGLPIRYEPRSEIPLVARNSTAALVMFFGPDPL